MLLFPRPSRTKPSRLKNLKPLLSKSLTSSSTLILLPHLSTTTPTELEDEYVFSWIVSWLTSDLPYFSQHIPSMIVWLWAEPHSRYCCFYLTRETVRQVLHLFRIADWLSMNIKKTWSLGQIQRIFWKLKSILVLASHWHHFLVLVGKWLGEWFDSLCSCFCSRPTFFESYGTLTPVSGLNGWRSLLLKRRLCQRRWWVRYSNWFTDFWSPENARFCQLRWGKSFTRLE